MKTTITIKRIYDEAAKKDGYRILVDRLWPRGLKKEDAKIDEWAKELAPGTELRKWFGHDPERWEAFQKKYRAELKKNKELGTFVEQYRNKKHITLLYGAKDEAHAHAIVLKDVMEQLF